MEELQPEAAQEGRRQREGEEKSAKLGYSVGDGLWSMMVHDG